MSSQTYDPKKFGGEKELEFHTLFKDNLDDGLRYFNNVLKPRLDRSYKLYVGYGGDRQREIQKWQSNIFIPYTQAVVETLVPRILDARPDFSAIARDPNQTHKAEKQQQLNDFYWEQAKMDAVSEEHVRASLIFGTSFLQVRWKTDIRNLQFFAGSDINSKTPKFKLEERVFFDGPVAEWVDPYSLFYDWHSIRREDKQYWIRRRVLTEDQIKRNYPMYSKKRLEAALGSGPGDTKDYASIRNIVKTVHTRILKGDYAESGETEIYNSASRNKKATMYEVFEWLRPFDDTFGVMVGAARVPILGNRGYIPNPFDFKETPFIETTFLKLPGEFEGIGFPLILENPQIMLNVVKNQRLDAATLNIHKMWIVNPLANINKTELVTRPFGIIYSIDPNGVKEVQFSDIKSSAYQEEETLKSDLRYASGVDDFSMGVDSGANSATAIRHLRESTLERVRMFVNHLGDSYADVMRYWMSMSRQFLSEDMTIRIVGEDGRQLFPLIQKDDLVGMFDYKAKVLPSIAGQNDVEKKQAMDLVQLLLPLQFLDQKKIIGNLVSKWGISLDSISADEQTQSLDGQMPGADQQSSGFDLPQAQSPMFKSSSIPSDVLNAAIAKLRRPGEGVGTSGAPTSFDQFSSPVNLLQTGGIPPTVKGVPNNAGFNRGGKVNTNIPINGKNSSVESNLLNRTFNIQ